MSRPRTYTPTDQPAFEPLEPRLLLSSDPLGNEFRVNLHTSGDQTDVALGADASGNYVAVWQGANAHGWGTNEIYLQRYNAEGTRLGPEQRANPDWHGEQTNPDVGVADDGTFVVSWTTSDDGDSYGVNARVFAADGTPLTDAILVNTYTDGNQSDSEVAINVATGDLVVVWTSNGQDESGWGVYGQRFAADGTPVGDEFQVNTYTDGDQSDPMVAMASDGDFVVTWRSNGQDGSGWGVYGQRFASDGTPVGEEFRVNTYTSSHQYDPAVAVAPGGEFVVAWESNGQDGSSYGVYAQRYAADGTAVGEEFQVNTYTSSEQRRPDIAFFPDGGFIIGWDSAGQDGSDWGVYGQRFAADGTPLGGEFRANTYTSYSQYAPAVAPGTDGDFLIAWQSERQDGSGYGIYGQFYGEGLEQADLVPVKVTAPGGANLGQTISVSAKIRNQGSVDAGPFVCQYYLSEDPVITSEDTPLGGLFTVDGLDAYATHTDSRQIQVAWNAPTGDHYIGLLVDVNDEVPEADEANNGTAMVAFPAMDVRPSDPVMGGEFRLNRSTSSDQQGVSLDTDAAGNYVAVWLGASRDGFYGKRIYGQRYNQFGTPLGPEFEVSTRWSNYTLSPHVAVAADGRFVVCWALFSTGTIRARRYLADGTPLGEPFTVATSGKNEERSPSVAINIVTGGFVVVWTSDGQDGSGKGVYGQRFAADGTPVGDEFRVNTYTDGDQDLPAVAMAPGGEFVVTWTSNGQDGSGWGVYVQRFASDGTPVGEEFRVNTYTSSHQLDPAVAVGPGGEFVVAWESNGQDGSSYGVYAQRYAADGTPLDEEFQVNTYTSSGQRRPDIAFFPDGGFIIGWDSYGQDGSDYGVYAQRYASDGTVLGGEFRANTYTSYYQYAPAVAAGTGGDFLIAWQSQHQDGSEYGIYGQMYGEGLDQADLVPVKVTAPAGANLGQTISVSAKIRNQGSVDAGPFVCQYYLSTDPVITATDTPLGGMFTVDGVDAHSTRKDSRTFAVPDVATGDWYLGIIVDTADAVIEADEANNIYEPTFYESTVNIADPPMIGPERQANTHTQDEQSAPSVGFDAAGNYVTVWQSRNQDGSGYGIYGQRFDATGTPVGGEFQVNEMISSDQKNPQVAVAPDGRFVIVWQSQGEDGSGWGAYARRYNADGLPAGGAFLVNTYTHSDQSDPSVSIAENGDFVIVWRSAGQDVSNNGGIYGQRYFADGSPNGPEFWVCSNAAPDQARPAVAMNGAGQFVVAWDDGGTVYARRFLANGTAADDEFIVNSYGSSNQNYPSVAIDAAGNFVIAWRSSGQDGSSWGVYAQRYAADGERLGDEFRVNTYTSGEQRDPAVAMDADGDFVITWHSYGQDGSGWGVFAQRFAADGSSVGGEFRVNVVTYDDQTWPAVAMQDLDHFLVAWQSDQQDSSSYGIFTQLIGTSDVNARPNLTVTQLSGPSSVHLGESIDLQLTIQNTGMKVAPPSTARLYLSDDNTFDSGIDLDTGIQVPVPQILYDSWNNTYQTTIGYTWPSTDPFGTDRDYYFILAADDGAVIEESNETDNLRVSNVAELRMPDLQGWVSVPSATVPGQTVPISVTVQNRGDAQAPPSVGHLWLSDNGDTDDVDLLIDVPVPQLSTYYWPDNSRQSFNTTVNYVWPEVDPIGTDGQYRFVLRLDVDDQLIELNEPNNRVLSNSFGVSQPNLIVYSLAAPTYAEPGEQVTVTVEVRNTGTEPADPSTLHLWLADDADDDPAAHYDLFIDVPVPALDVYRSPSYPKFQTDVTFNWPSEDPFGTDLQYHVVAKADAYDDVREGNEEDNLQASSAVRLQVPDLELARVRVPSTVQSGQQLLVHLEVRNAGWATVPESTAHVWLSDNNVFGDADDRELTPPLDISVPEITSNGRWSADVTIPWPDIDPFGTDGEYFVIVGLDYQDQIAEGNETNNVAVSASLALVTPMDLDIQLAGHLGGASYAVAVQGDYAYEMTSAGLRVLDVSDPAGITKVYECVFPVDRPIALHAEGDRLYVVDDQNSRAFDISIPYQPHLLAEDFEGELDIDAIVFRGDIAFAADNEQQSLYVLNIDDPLNIVTLAQYPVRGRVSGLALEDTLVCLSYEDPILGRPAIEIVDVSDLSLPVFISRRGFDAANAGPISVSGNLAAILHGWYDDPSGSYSDVRVTLVDVSDPTLPRTRGTYVPWSEYGRPWTSMVFSLALSGRDLHVVECRWNEDFEARWHLTLVDVTDPTDPAPVGAVDVGEVDWARAASVLALRVEGASTYVANRDLVIVDTSDRFNPVVLGSYGEVEGLQHIAMAGSTAFVVAGQTMEVIDVSEPSVPSHVGTYTFTRHLDELLESGTYVLGISGMRSSGSGEVEIVDVSDPRNPTLAGIYEVPEDYPYLLDATVAGDLLCVLTGKSYSSPGIGGLTLVDISDPANPLETYTSDVFLFGGGSSPEYIHGRVCLDNDLGRLYVAHSRPSDAEPNDAMESAVELGHLASPLVVSGAIGYNKASGSDTYDYYHFAGTEGDVLTVDLRGRDEGTGTFYKGNVRLYDNAVSQLLYVSYSAGAEIQDFLLPYTGDYYVRVYSTGSYGYAYDLAFGLNGAPPVAVPEPYFGLMTYDVSDPANPLLLSRVNVDQPIAGMFADGSHVYLSLADPGMLQVVDFTDPADPSVLGSCQVENAGEILVSGSLASIGAGNSLQIVDVSDPARPVALESYAMSEEVGGIAIEGVLTFVAADSLYALSVRPAGVEVADLAVTQLALPPAVQLGTDLAVSWTVRNHGQSPAEGTWTDAVFLSSDVVLDENDVLLGEVPHTGPLDSLDTYAEEASPTIAGVEPGYYYVIVWADANDDVNEWHVEANNIRVSSQPIYVGHPDLTITNITVPEVVERGDLLPVQWTVYNRDYAPASWESWTDQIYFSTDEQFDPGEDLPVGVHEHTGGLAERSVYHATLDVDTAPIPDDIYYVIVVSDAGGAVLEDGREGNNVRVSENPFRLGVPALTLGETHNDAFDFAGQYKYYRVAVDAGEHLFVSLDDANDIGHNELYVKYRSAPSRSDYDARYGENLASDQVVEIPDTQAGNYYILVYSETAPDAPADFTLTASVLDFTISGISPTYGGNTGNVTVTVRGAGFTHDTEVSLVDDAGGTILPGEVWRMGSASVSATFDLTGRPTGPCDVIVSEPGGAFQEVEGIFRIEEGRAEEPICGIESPSIARPGLPFTVWVEYGNPGNVDIPAPLLIVTSPEGAPMSLERGLADTSNKIQLLGINPFGLPSVLPPGTHNRIPLYSTIFDSATWHFELESLVESSDPVDWDALEVDVQPEWIGDDAWDAVWDNFVHQVGGSWADYARMLRENADYLAQFGEAQYHVRDLVAFEMRQADSLCPARHLAGAVDASAATGALPLEFIRSYAQPISRRYDLGPLGRGWVHSWQVSLDIDSDGIARVTDWSGTPRVFLPDGGGGFLAKGGDNGELRRTGTGQYRLAEVSGLVTVFDSGGRLAYVEDVNGNRVTAEHSNGRLTRLVHSNGRDIRLEYNAAGRITRVIDPGGTGTADDLITTFAYDASGGHLVEVTAPGGRVTRYGYQAGGTAQAEHALASVEYPDGTHDYFYYDDHGHLVGTQKDGGAEAITFVYDSTGIVVTEDALGGQTTFWMGPAGRVLRVRDAEGNAVSLEYDDAYQPVALTMPDGQNYEYTYDGLGNLVAIEDPAGNATWFTYEPAHYNLGSILDARGNGISYEYDWRGNLLSITYEDGTSESYTYDATGAVQTWTNRRGQVVTFGYNALGLPISKDYSATPGVVDYEYAYDTAGNLISATNASGTISMMYDPDTDWLTRIDYPGGHFFTFEYDNVSRRTTRTDEAGNTVHYVYDTIGHLDQMMDAADALLVDYNYDAAGRLVRKTLGNGVYSTYAYDNGGRLTSLVNYAPDDSVLSRCGYTYDSAGRRISMTTLDGTYTYGYDPLGQITSVAYPDGHMVIYEYDAVGNRIEVNDDGARTDYTTNEMNQYTDVGGVTYNYDADGNMISKTAGGVTTAYTYNIENRLVAVTTPDDTWEYVYDAMGNLVATIHNGTATQYVVDPIGFGDVAAEYDAAGSLIARYDHGYGLLSRTDDAGAAGWYTFDAIGSTNELTDSGGIVLNSYAYDPFGILLSRSGDVDNPFEYVGEYGVADDGSGLLHMRARFYDPVLGRFTSFDPIGLLGGDINLYRYVENNPANLIDPVGLCVGDRVYSGAIYSARTLATVGEHFGKVGKFGKLAGKALGWLGTLTSIWDIGKGINEGDVGKVSKEIGYLGLGLIGAANFWNPFGWAALGATGLGVVSDIWADWQQEKASGSHCSWDSDPSRPPSPGDVDEDFEDHSETSTRRPVDPNEKVGPAGHGEAGYITGMEALPYDVLFENDPELGATLPAAAVYITDALDTDLDWTTFELTEIVFGDYVLTVPQGLTYYSTTADLRPDGLNLLVEIEAGLDSDTGTAYWQLVSIDPDTGEPPDDPLLGFLPVNDKALHNGEGRVSYIVGPDAGLPTGTEITNSASIVFDVNDPIVTNEVLNTIDIGLPTSQVHALPGQVPDEPLTVTWSGEDDENGSGIATCTVYVSTDGGPWGVWLQDTADTSAVFNGIGGHSYAFRSVATDGVGHVEDDPGEVEASTSLDFSQFRVDWLEAIPSGFVAHFKRQLDPSVLNLYDNESGMHGPADMTVVGDTVGLVAGSLVYDPDDKTATFIKTGGPLQPDTYTVTLRSGSDGFKDSEGHLLDGDADDVEGGDYVAALTVDPSTAKVLSIPDFARGPGQVVDVPATEAAIPITINDASDVLSVDFVLEYDPALLSIGGVSLASGLPTGTGMAYNLSTPGQLAVTIYATEPLGTGETPLVLIEANIPDDAPYSSAAELQFSDIRINEGLLAGQCDSAVQVIAYLGDVTGNHTYSGLDSAYIARVAAGVDGGFAAYRMKDPVIVGDVTANGALSGLDAAYVARKVVGLAQPEIPDLPGTLPPIVSGGPDPLLSIPDDITATQGSILAVPILLDDAAGFLAGDIDLEYDTVVLDLTNQDVQLGGLLSGWALVANVDDSTGTARIVLYSATPLENGAGALAELAFTVRPDAPLGETVIDLQDSTSLNEGALVLTLEDGTITIGPLVDVTSPTVTGVTVSDGLQQRSMVSCLAVEFSERVLVSPDAVTLVWLPGIPLMIIDDGSPDDNFDYDAQTCTLTLAFCTSLPEGRYRLTILGSSVCDLAENHLDGDGDGSEGGNHIFGFHVLRGDSNGDAKTNIFDLLKVQQNYLKPHGPGRDDNADVTGDGSVNIFDLLMVRQNYLRELPLAAGGASADFVAAAMASQESLTVGAPSTAKKTADTAQPLPSDTTLPASMPELAIRRAEDAPLPTPATEEADLAVAPSSLVSGVSTKKMAGVPIRALGTTAAGSLRFAGRTKWTIPLARKPEPTTSHSLSLAEDDFDVLAVPPLDVPLGV